MLVWHPDGIVEFRFFRPGAHRVHLVGDFNGWEASATVMFLEPSGDWVRCLRLQRGTYRFKYLADGEWFPDYAAFGVEWGPLGVNSVAVIDEAVLSSGGSVSKSALAAAGKLKALSRSKCTNHAGGQTDGPEKSVSQ